MKIVLSDRALVAVADAPADVRKAFRKQLAFLESGLRRESAALGLAYGLNISSQSY